MPATIVNGKKIAEKIYARLGPAVKKLEQKGFTPHLGVVLVGNNPASESYVKNKGKAAEAAGLKFSLFRYPSDISEKKLFAELLKLQKKVSGIIVQLPLPAHIKRKQELLNSIEPTKDVDCLTYHNIGALSWRYKEFIPPTPGAILEVMKYHKVDLVGKYIVLVGRGDLVGKPLSSIFMYDPVTVTTCSRWTKSAAAFTKKADIIITGTGIYKMITGAKIKKGAVVIDAGVSFDKKGVMHGDIHFESVVKKASLATPTPGGIGPITVAKLIENTVYAACKRAGVRYAYDNHTPYK